MGRSIKQLVSAIQTEAELVNTFAGNGDVERNKKHFEELMGIAKALEIKGAMPEIKVSVKGAFTEIDSIKWEEIKC